LPLAGATVVLKDNILTKGYRTTGASTMLEEYIAPYSATCYERLVEAGERLIGKANMDDSAM
jgi:aspartyl-tRNA(Asn)/glutamyl-tRNA(Gln) amidotransferase subunit A